MDKMTKFINKIFIVLILVVCSCLSACTTVQTTPMIEQTSLLQPCDIENSPLPVNYTLNDKGQKVYDGKELFRVLREWQDYYSQCALMHNTLVNTINSIQSMKSTKAPK